MSGIICKLTAPNKNFDVWGILETLSVGFAKRRNSDYFAAMSRCRSESPEIPFGGATHERSTAEC
jgi:hypothetical protein